MRKKFANYSAGLAVFLSIMIFGGSMRQPQNEVPTYMDKDDSISQRVNDLLNRMTLEEKINLLGGTGFGTKPIERLRIPLLKMSDGPLGVRWDKSTAFPAATCMAASWDTSLINKVGKSIAEELKGKGRNVILGPCVNIARLPLGGRTFEAYGEDPYLASRMAVSYIEGVQSEGVAATVKHFAANNQEYERMFVDEKIDHRTLNEIYFPAFKAAVEEAKVLCVMSAYNKINGQYCSENDYLLKTKLKDDWKFDGLVMSDWGAVHSTIPTAKGSLDLEMPTGEFLNEKTLLDSVKAGVVKEETINDKVRRILTVMFNLGLFEKNEVPDTALVNTPPHRQIAYQAALEGIVLLKNETSILPLNLDKIKSIAVIGPNAAVARTTGGGSAMVSPVYSVSPLEALQNKLGARVKINYAEGATLSGDISAIDSRYFYLPDRPEHGIAAEYFDNQDLSGQPKVAETDDQINFNWHGQPPLPGIPGQHFSARWTMRILADETGDYSLDVVSDDGARLYVDGKIVINDWSSHGPAMNSYRIHLEKGKFYDIKLEYFQDTGGSSVKLGIRQTGDKLFATAIDAARNSDVAIVFAGTSAQFETEGKDRDNLGLPNDQDALINEVAKANKNTIVVMITGSPVLMNDWIDNVEGLVQAWFGGDEAGNAIVDVLLGKHNPSGKLPMTFPIRWEDCSAYNSYKKQDSVSVYSDGIFVGYRWFDEHDIRPLFPFGYGLSYTTFSYSEINGKAVGDSYEVTFEVKNVGNVEGVEIPQLYIHDPDKAIISPVKELKRFDRISLQPGETTEVKFSLKKIDFAHYNADKEAWETHPGTYDILVGSSSRDIKLETKIKIE
ncbi:MAG TPA: glycoside hydrolase family 3 C-terminal domain-containing protein [Candidatus Acidoferrales bacterium]|nr:glycoside hydrolase family 3 C-terminal domain-containing protein [Candidatus Acidoferrales bacterium]